MPPKRAKGGKGAKSSAAGTGTKGATGTGTSKGRKATDTTTKGTKGRRTKGSDNNWIGKSNDHLDADYKERQGRSSRRATSPHEADDPTYTPPGGHVTSIHPQRRSPRKADKADPMGYIDPDNIDQDVGDNEDGVVFDEDELVDDVGVVDGVKITSSPNQKAMTKLRRYFFPVERVKWND
jgi:hypothetical protein